jgi:histone H2A|eukprot:GFUD01036765.1.p3 GENE.GFUD01036765.1~~GFUD01036765.1.p3  ORF type:complete len:143 (+),score=9.90 GFUD01036765.1:58-429(+)
MATPSRRSARKATKKTAKGNRTGLIMPAGRIGSALRRARYAKRTSRSAGIYMAAALEYLTAELLELSSKATLQAKKKKISPRAITLATKADADLGALLRNTTISRGGIIPSLAKALESKKAKK